MIALLLGVIGSRGNGSRGWHLRAATMTGEVNVTTRVREEGEAANVPALGSTGTRRRMVRELVRRALEMSDAIDDPATPPDDRADYARRLDRMHAHAGGISTENLARMRLLEMIERSIAVEPVVARSRKIRQMLARRGLGEVLSPEEIEILSSEDPEVVRETRELEDLMDTSEPINHRALRLIVNTKFIEGTEAHRLNVIHYFAQGFPEYREALSSVGPAFDAAIVAFTRGRGQPRKNSTEPPKWEALAALMRAAGLGDIKAGALEQEWHAWMRRRDQIDPPVNKRREGQLRSKARTGS